VSDQDEAVLEMVRMVLVVAVAVNRTVIVAAVVALALADV